MAHAQQDRTAVPIKTRTEAWLVTYAIAVGSGRARPPLSRNLSGHGAAGCLPLACTGVVFLAGAKLLEFGQAGCRPRFRRALCAATPRARPRSVVVDPGSGRLVAVQGHALRATQIYPRPARRARRLVARISNAQSGSLNLTAPRAPARRGAERLPGTGSKAPDRQSPSRAAVALTTVKLAAPAARPARP